MWLFALLGCSLLNGPPIPQVVVDKVAGDLCAVGHPKATFVAAHIVNWRNEGGTEKTHDRYVDIAVDYQRKKEKLPNQMTLRLYLITPYPCNVGVDVLEDNGPKAVLLDNAVTSEIAGQAICDAMGR